MTHAYIEALVYRLVALERNGTLQIGTETSMQVQSPTDDRFERCVLTNAVLHLTLYDAA